MAVIHFGYSIPGLIRQCVNTANRQGIRSDPMRFIIQITIIGSHDSTQVKIAESLVDRSDNIRIQLRIGSIALEKRAIRIVATVIIMAFERFGIVIIHTHAAFELQPFERLVK